MVEQSFELISPDFLVNFASQMAQFRDPNFLCSHPDQINKVLELLRR